MLTSLLAVLLTAVPPPSSSAAPDLPALLKALGEADAAVERLAHALDMTRTEHQDELDRQGQPKHTVDRVVRMTHPQGQEREELISERKDGKDITLETRTKFDEAQESYREAQRAQPQKAEDRVSAKSPLSEDEQPKYAFRLDHAPAPGQVRLHFEPREREAKGLYEGDALVDVGDTAHPPMPLTVSMRPAKLPLGVQDASLTLEYQRSSMGPLLSKVAFQGEGGFLFFKRRYRGMVTFTDSKRP